MNLDDIKAEWQKRHLADSGEQFQDLSEAVADRVGQFEKKLKRRDLIEAGAATFVSLFFLLALMADQVPVVAKAGVVIIILAAIVSVGLLYAARHRDAEPDRKLPLGEFCAAEMKRIDRQIWLLSHVSWWYSGPILLGCCVLFYGILQPIPELPDHIRYGFLAATYVCFLAAGFILYRTNMRAVKTELEPFRKDLQDIAEALREDASAD